MNIVVMFTAKKMSKQRMWHNSRIILQKLYIGKPDSELTLATQFKRSHFHFPPAQNLSAQTKKTP
jgi:hypothetical protein